MSKLSWPHEKLDNYIWKTRAEAVKNITSVNSKTGEKVLFQNSIQKSMGIEKNHRFPTQNAPAFSHAVQLN